MLTACSSDVCGRRQLALKLADLEAERADLEARLKTIYECTRAFPVGVSCSTALCSLRSIGSAVSKQNSGSPQNGIVVELFGFSSCARI